MSRAERNRAWSSLVFACHSDRLTKVGLVALRKAGEALMLSAEDMEDIESAIGYRSEDLAALYPRYASVRKFKPSKSQESVNAPTN